MKSFSLLSIICCTLFSTPSFSETIYDFSKDIKTYSPDKTPLYAIDGTDLPLEFAIIQYGSLDDIQKLIDKGLDTNKEILSGLPPLGVALYETPCNPKKVKLLINNGSKLVVDDWSAMYIAVSNKQEDLGCLKALITSGADINHQDIHGNSPIMLALMSLNTGAMNFLYEKGANPYLKNDSGEDFFYLSSMIAIKSAELDLDSKETLESVYHIYQKEKGNRFNADIRP
jgi:ankyrin repeat protein